jgi:hypothetical protein
METDEPAPAPSPPVFEIGGIRSSPVSSQGADAGGPLSSAKTATHAAVVHASKPFDISVHEVTAQPRATLKAPIMSRSRMIKMLKKRPSPEVLASMLLEAGNQAMVEQDPDCSSNSGYQHCVACSLPMIQELGTELGQVTTSRTGSSSCRALF